MRGGTLFYFLMTRDTIVCFDFLSREYKYYGCGGDICQRKRGNNALRKAKCVSELLHEVRNILIVLSDFFRQKRLYYLER